MGTDVRKQVRSRRNNGTSRTCICIGVPATMRTQMVHESTVRRRDDSRHNSHHDTPRRGGAGEWLAIAFAQTGYWYWS